MSIETYVFSGTITEEETVLSLAELSRACAANAEWIMTLVDEGILEPQQCTPSLRFAGPCLKRVRTVQRLQRDLGVNLAGAALALELLEEVGTLRARLTLLETLQGSINE